MSDSSPGMGSGQRLTQSNASSIDWTCQIQKPAINSLVSAKGPSMTVFRSDVRLFAGHGIRTALDPVQRLVHRLDLPDPEAGDQFLGLGEGAIHDGLQI